MSNTSIPTENQSRVDPGTPEWYAVIKSPARNLDIMTPAVQDNIGSNGHFQAVVFFSFYY
jgi:hypothetical protein